MSTIQDLEGAKQYLAKHNLHTLFEDLAADVINQRPEQPLQFLYEKIGKMLPPGTVKQETATPKQETTTTATTETAKTEAPKQTTPKLDRKVVFVLGGPGSGKGTQCDKLVELGMKHVSTGDLLRDEQKKGTENSKLIESYIKDGKVVPGEITISLLKQWILTQPVGSTILVDGFPREMVQALDFERDVAECDFVLYFEAADSTLEKRLLKRGLTSGRADDNLETIQKRLATFHTQTSAVVEYFSAKKKVRRVSAEADANTVFAATKVHFQ